MSVLIKETELATENSSMFELIDKKLEESIISEKTVVICINNEFSCVKNTVKIDTYELDENNFSLACGNFEFNFVFDDTTTIVYQNDLDECFIISNQNMECCLYFI